jgi:hypothetical protein
MALVDDHETPDFLGEMATTHLFVRAKNDWDGQPCRCPFPLGQEHCRNQTGGRSPVQSCRNGQGHERLSAPDGIGQDRTAISLDRSEHPPKALSLLREEP